MYLFYLEHCPPPPDMLPPAKTSPIAHALFPRQDKRTTGAARGDAARLPSKTGPPSSCRSASTRDAPSQDQSPAAHGSDGAPSTASAAGPEVESAAQAAAASPNHGWSESELAACFVRPGMPSDAASAAKHADALGRIERLRICRAGTAKFRGTPSPSSSTEAASTTTGPTQKRERKLRYSVLFSKLTGAVDFRSTVRF